MTLFKVSDQSYEFYESGTGSEFYYVPMARTKGPPHVIPRDIEYLE